MERIREFENADGEMFEGMVDPYEDGTYLGAIAQIDDDGGVIEVWSQDFATREDAVEWVNTWGTSF